MVVTHHSSEERQVETTCSAPIALLGSWSQSGGCGEEAEDSWVCGSPGFKITLFFVFLQLVSPWAMQQQLLPIPPTCTLERILPSKQVCRPYVLGGKSALSMWLGENVKWMDFEKGGYRIGIWGWNDLLVHKIRLLNKYNKSLILIARKVLYQYIAFLASFYNTDLHSNHSLLQVTSCARTCMYLWNSVDY